MANLPRKTQKVFGSNLTASGNVAIVGSTASGSPSYSTDLAAIQSLTAYLNGFAAQTVKNSSPVLQEFNALLLMITQQLAYILQKGLADWDAGTTYYLNDYCKVGAVQYVSLQDNNLNQLPLTQPTWWAPVIPDIPAPTPPTNPLQLPKAWVRFSGTTGTINASFNVSSVVRTGPGSYLITFATPMADAAYGVLGTAGAGNGQPRSNNGNNNCICMDNTSTTTQVSVWCPKPDTNIGEDPDLVAVWVFGN